MIEKKNMSCSRLVQPGGNPQEAEEEEEEEVVRADVTLICD